MELGALWYLLLFYGLPAVLVGAIIVGVAVLLGYVYAWFLSVWRKKR